MIGIGVKRVTLGLPKAQPTKVYGGLALFVVFLTFLAALGYAETVWLPDGLPRDHATRITLVALPRVTPDMVAERPQASLPANWDRLVMKEAAQPELLQRLVSALDLRDAATGASLSSEQLLQGMKQGGQCIEVNAAEGRVTPGLLIYSVFRGPDPGRVNKKAQEWTRLFTERSSTAFPGLVIQPIDSLGVPYQICRAH